MGSLSERPEQSYRYDYLFDMVKQLKQTTASLRVFGVITLLMTLCNLAALVGQVISAALVYQSNQAQIDSGNGIYARHYLSYWWLAASLIVLAFTLTILGVSDLLRRRGDVFFQELSNTLQEIGDEQASDFREKRAALMAQARIAIRSFASSADPPLIRGRFGTGIYALVNVIIVVIAVIFYAQAI